MSHFRGGQIIDDTSQWVACLNCKAEFIIEAHAELNMLFDLKDRVLKPICPTCGVTDVKQTYPGTIYQPPQPEERLDDPLFVKSGDGKVQFKLGLADNHFFNPFDPDNYYVCEPDVPVGSIKKKFTFKDRVAGFIEKTFKRKNKN